MFSAVSDSTRGACADHVARSSDYFRRYNTDNILQVENRFRGSTLLAQLAVNVGGNAYVEGVSEFIEGRHARPVAFECRKNCWPWPRLPTAYPQPEHRVH